MVIYFIISCLILTASGFVFSENLVISGASAVPLGLAGISALQAFLFRALASERMDHTTNISYSTHELDYDALRLSMKYHALTRLSIIPLLCVFAVYFDTIWKIVFSVCIYFFGFLTVRPLVKLRLKKQAK